MISVKEATAKILSHPMNFDAEAVPLQNVFGRLLLEDLFADTDLPPFDRVMMDGIAVRSSDVLSGNRKFEITGIQRAGDHAQELGSVNTCMEVMTGAVCPTNADAIIPYELVQIENNIATIGEITMREGMNIHARATDYKAGDLLVKAHSTMSTSIIGVVASIGRTELGVAKYPGVHIFSTGDELVEVHETPAAHQIRRSSVHVLKAMLKARGIEASESHLSDDESMIRSALSDALEKKEVILITGGVSKGKFDLIPEMLKSSGVEQIFHRIAQKPGKPMWFGRNEKTTVFAFPGNPVSTVVCARRYLMPWLDKSFRKNSPTLKVALAHDIQIKTGLTIFSLVGVAQHKDGLFYATEVKGNGSGDFVSLSKATGFIELPDTKTAYVKGELVDYYDLF